MGVHFTDDSTSISMDHSTRIIDDSTPILLTILLMNLFQFYSHSTDDSTDDSSDDSTPILLPFWWL